MCNFIPREYGPPFFVEPCFNTKTCNWNSNFNRSQCETASERTLTNMNIFTIRESGNNNNRCYFKRSNWCTIFSSIAISKKWNWASDVVDIFRVFAVFCVIVTEFSTVSKPTNWGGGGIVTESYIIAVEER
jgi:hypothetical protein